MEDNTHRFIQRPIACQIWSYISQNWQVLYHGVLFDTKIAGVCTNNSHKGRSKNKRWTPVLLFQRAWGLCHNWDMRNAFVFDGHEVKAYL